MKLAARWIVPALGLSLVLPLSVLRADEPAAANGTIAGKVVGEDGHAAGSVRVVVTHARAKQPKKKDTAAEPPAAPAPGNGEAPKRPAPVANTTTSSDGSFTVMVPAGDYNVAAGDRKAGAWGREKVTVTAGQTADVTITLKKAPAGEGRGEGEGKGKGEGKKPRN